VTRLWFAKKGRHPGQEMKTRQSIPSWRAAYQRLAAPAELRLAACVAIAERTTNLAGCAHIRDWPGDSPKLTGARLTLI
jgi:hypothetical protein